MDRRVFDEPFLVGYVQECPMVQTALLPVRHFNSYSCALRYHKSPWLFGSKTGGMGHTLTHNQIFRRLFVSIINVSNKQTCVVHPAAESTHQGRQDPRCLEVYHQLRSAVNRHSHPLTDVGIHMNHRDWSKLLICRP